MMLDYVLTKIALATGICEEANILMRWLVNMPFVPGLITRAAICGVLIIPFYLVKQQNITYYWITVSVAIAINLFAMFMHSLWIIKVLKL